MPALKGKLSPRQQRFIDYYIINPNAREAALKAGYSPHTATVIGRENLLKPYIASEIDRRLNKEHKWQCASAEEVLNYLTKTLRDESIDIKERTKVADLLGKRHRLFAEKVEITGNEGSAIKVEHTHDVAALEARINGLIAKRDTRT